MFSIKIENLADMIMKSDKNTVTDKEIIVYGLKSIITQGISIVITAVLGYIFGLLLESIVFLVSFSAIRMYAGGYHCRKAIHCYVMSSGIMVLVLTVVKITPIWYMLPISIFILLVSIPIILKFAPVGAINKPLDEVEKQHYRKITIHNLGIECFIISIMLVTELNNFAFVMSLGIMITAGVVILQKKEKYMKKNSVFVVLLTIAMILSLSISSFAAENNTVTESDAYNVAINFVMANGEGETIVDTEGDLYAHGVSTIQEEGFPKEFAIKKIQSFYDNEQKISAYYMPIVNTDNINSGYVIVSADNSEYPIIEYAFDGVFYMENVTEKIVKDKGIALSSSDESNIYYLGGLCYAASVNNTSYVVNDTGYEEVEDLNTFEIDKNISKDEEHNIKIEWNALESGGSNPPIGSFITTPDSYESGYSSKTTDYCYGMGTSYYKMTDFHSGEVCTPTAATNLCLYWTRRNAAYSNLCNGTWKTTFNRISTLMETSTSTGTIWPSPARVGILNYFKERGLSNTEAYYSTCTSTTHFNNYIKAEINVGRPVLIAVWKDKMYKNHTVLGLGYTRYMYNGSYTSHYIRINDGWSTSVNRYIHYETGRDSMTRIRVIPG